MAKFLLKSPQVCTGHSVILKARSLLQDQGQPQNIISPVVL